MLIQDFCETTSESSSITYVYYNIDLLGNIIQNSSEIVNLIYRQSVEGDDFLTNQNWNNIIKKRIHEEILRLCREYGQFFVTFNDLYYYLEENYLENKVFYPLNSDKSILRYPLGIYDLKYIISKGYIDNYLNSTPTPFNYTDLTYFINIDLLKIFVYHPLSFVTDEEKTLIQYRIGIPKYLLEKIIILQNPSSEYIYSLDEKELTKEEFDQANQYILDPKEKYTEYFINLKSGFKLLK